MSATTDTASEFQAAAHRALSADVLDRMEFAPVFRTWGDVALTNAVTQYLLAAGFEIVSIRDADAGMEWCLNINGPYMILRARRTVHGLAEQPEVVPHMASAADVALFHAALNRWAQGELDDYADWAATPGIDYPGLELLRLKVSAAQAQGQIRAARRG